MKKRAQTNLNNLPSAANRYIHTYNFLGLVFAVIFFCLSLFPSLLPRSWFFQGLVSGIALSVGYGLGVLASFVIRWLFERDILIKVKETVWKLFYILGSLLVLTFLILGGVWQNQLRVVVDVPPIENTHVIREFILAIIIGVLCVKLGRSIRRLYDLVLKKVGKIMPRRISTAISLALVGLFIIWVVSGAFMTFLGTVSGILYDRKNNSTADGITQPYSTTRSGSKDSIIPWDTLGYQGQKFVATGPNQDQLKDLSGIEPSQQIRIYAGVNSAPSASERAALVIKEMKRTDAFKRKVLVVAVPTGTGWLNAQSVDALEYLYAGDSAIVAQQYSYLPSWISFLVDKQKAQDTAKALFDAVYSEWAVLPQNERPKLIMYGLSLGAFGGQSAFSGPSNMLHSVDGALWQGTPGDTELWKEVTRRRDAGSPEWQPIIDNGDNVRFASQNQDLTKDQSTWGSPRVLYMQHGSDPIVWFNFNLPLNKPDWTSEKRAPDVMKNTVWVPFVTFFQLAADQVVGMNVPRSYGHNYETSVSSAWASVAAPEGWTQAKSNTLQAIIDSY